MRYVGKHQVIGLYSWIKFAVVDEAGAVVAYISGRPDGAAHPQPLDPASSPLPHFMVGKDELGSLLSWLERGLPVVVEGTINRRITPGARSRNLIASFGPDAGERRLGRACTTTACTAAPAPTTTPAAWQARCRRSAGAWPASAPTCPSISSFSPARNGAGRIAGLHGRPPGRGAAPATKMLINLDSISEGDSLELWAGPEGFEAEIQQSLLSFTHSRMVRKTSYFPPPPGSDHVPFYRACPGCRCACSPLPI